MKKIVLWIVLLSAVGAAVSATGPLTVSANGRYLQSGSTPVLLNGDAGYSLMVQLTSAQASTYLTDRANRGFNVVIANLIEHYFSAHPPANVNGVRPFTGAAFTTPNEAYFALVDTILAKADSLGIYVLLFPLYLGDPFQQGWGQEVYDGTDAMMTYWGNYVGNRYKNRPNIIWVIGGDFGTSPLNATIRQRLDAFTAALKAADNVYPRMITAHCARGQVISNLFGPSWGENWLNLNNIYSGSTSTDLVPLATTAYNYSPTLPFFNIEGNYENEGASAQVVRAQAYWTILSGGSGYVFGNCPIWGFGAPNLGCAGTWQTALSSPGSQAMSYFGSIFRSRNWYKMVPDRSGTVLTAGASSGTSLATFAYTTDSTSIIGYLPSQRSVTINPAVLKGDSIKVTWYNPSTGVSTAAGSFTKISRSYTPPSATDWVMIVDGGTSSPVVTPPAPPILVSPANGATSVAINPTLSWNASATATSYHVQVATDAAFGTIIVDQNNIATTSVAISGLSNGRIYYWHVLASNAAGPSAYSGASNFTTIISAPTPPTLVSPANGATSVAINPTLSWNASATATSYHVQVATDAAFGTIVADQNNLAATSTSISGLANNRIYYWHVSASNAGGPSAYSGANSFTTIVSAPSVPILASPANGATSVATNPTLSWNASATATSYHVQVATDAAFGTIIFDQNNIGATSVALSGLSNGTVYYWHVLASNAGGSSVYSSAFNFRTADTVVAPGVPTLVNPSNGAGSVATNPTLSWNTVTGATSYRVQVSTDQLFGTTVVDQASITATSLSLTGLGNSTTYYWRVAASNSAGSSNFATAFSFTTIVAPPSSPTLANPSNGATGVASNPTLSWNASLTATSYHLQVATDVGFGTIVVDQSNIAGTTLAVSGLTGGTTYYWHVLATNAGGSSLYSGAYSFATAVVQPAVPTLVSPADGASSVSTNPTLSWNPASGATSYRLQLATDAAFGSLVIDQSGIVTTSLGVSNLTAGSTYYWRVASANSGGPSLFSSANGFTTAIATSGQLPYLAGSSNGRYLQANGTPVFLNGEAAYSMIAQLTLAQAKSYLADRSAKGFNAISTNLIEYAFSTNAKPNHANIYGVAPFTGAPFTTPNNAYFALADSMIAAADSQGIYVFLFPLYLGQIWGTTAGQGWGQEVYDATPAAMRAWGTYVGNRYKNYSNIVWILGGDFGSVPLNATIKAQLDTFAVALKQADTVYPRLLTGHGGRGLVARSLFTSSWLNLNNVYSGATSTDVTSLATTAYTSGPTMPFFNVEGFYENEGAGVQTIRAQAYYSILKGGCGYLFGNCPIWGFNAPTLGCNSSTWQANLNSAGSMAMSYFGTLFRSRNWYSLVPDNSGSVITAGASSGTDLAAFAYAVDSTSIIGYIPTQRSVTISPLVLKGDSIFVTWFNPATGVQTSGGRYAKSARSYTPPTADDWVMVIDGNGVSVPQPTPDVPTLASPANGATGVATSPTLVWNPANYAASYRVQVSADPAFGTLLADQSGITTTSTSVSGLSVNTVYYWRVNGTNATGTSAFSSSFSFTTAGSAPAAPTLVTPANGATGIATSPTLTWNASPTATSYRVQVSTSSTFATTQVDQSNVTATSLAVTGLSVSTLYYWRVNASNGAGAGAYSTISNFTTTVAAPATPTLVSPSNGATGVSINPTLTWNTSARATSYRVQVATNSSFGSIVLDQSGIQATSLAVTGLRVNTTYYWRVSASNAGGNSANSNARNFRTSRRAAALAGGTTLLATGEDLPTSFMLEQNYPNPFNPTTTIEFSILTPSQVVLEIYNTQGELVTTLVNRSMGVGTYSVSWNGTSEGGRRVASGVYFYRLTAGDYRETKKMVMLK